ncbi:MgtE protein [Cohnella nanjingensis]|uniref:MgtE protein n=1 Tax=Cohnella nanjingensis TaxID=1387779 RepID=A0A7X0RVU0_9BACL|nr:MgtE protein [Cohnella nanjingensis]MBB6674597.1 MgtE protein [Cohnella nanjingensis]
MADANVEKSGYSGFERFLFFITPIIFTAVLLLVLLLLFNPTWRHAAQDFGNKIPLLSSIIPDRKAPAATQNGESQVTVNNAKQKVDELKTLLTDRDNALKQADGKAAQQQKTIDDLKSQVETLNKQISEKTITAESYDARIRSLADMYGKMTPGKAAPIMESLTVEESALVLGAMNDNQRGKVLEKMTPKVAADVTMRLKDAETVQEREISALQARIRELQNQSKSTTSGTALDNAALGKTFGAMDAKKAAPLLLQMAATEQSKALRILEAMDDTSRSKVLAEMSDQDKKKTAQLVSKLMPANP